MTSLEQALLRMAAPQDGRADEAPDVLQRCLRAMRSHLGMEVAFISEFTQGQRVFRHVDALPDAPQLEVGAGDPLEDSYCQRVVDGRLPELITDACQLPQALSLPVTQALPVGAHLSVPLRLSNGEVYGTLCCFSRQPDASLSARDLALLRVCADMAAEHIEQQQRGQQRRQALLTRLALAMQPGHMQPVFQPIYHLREQRVVGFEALTRFCDPPLRSPDQWFGEAAQVSRGCELELHAIELALQALADLPRPLYLALNASPNTVLDGRLSQLLAEFPLDRLVLELTEHEEVEQYSEIARLVTPLRLAGLRVAVDDAGAGYASFKHILNLAPDIIKLDISITRNIDADFSRQALAAALQRFAQATGGQLVAEGVERLEELESLTQVGVALAQGYALGRPDSLPRALERARQFKPAALSALRSGPGLTH